MIQPKQPENVCLTNVDCIAILENMKKRTCFYDEHYGHMGKEYCEFLAGIEQLAIDKAILAIQNQEQPSFPENVQSRNI